MYNLYKNLLLSMFAHVSISAFYFLVVPARDNKNTLKIVYNYVSIDSNVHIIILLSFIYLILITIIFFKIAKLCIMHYSIEKVNKTSILAIE